MSFLSRILGSATAEPIQAVGAIVRGVWGDKGEKLTHDEVMAKIAQNPMLAQTEINKVEAGHRSLFVSGWRPFIGWVCGIGLANSFLIAPYFGYFGEALPEVPTDIMLELVLAMLGLGALRTVEKLNGRSK